MSLTEELPSPISQEIEATRVGYLARREKDGKVNGVGDVLAVVIVAACFLREDRPMEQVIDEWAQSYKPKAADALQQKMQDHRWLRSVKRLSLAKVVRPRRSDPDKLLEQLVDGTAYINLKPKT